MSMIGSYGMRKVVQRRLMLYTLPGLWLLAAFLLSGYIEAGHTSTALAADTRVDRTNEQSQQWKQNCTGSHRHPSFGTAVVVDSNEIVCGDVTSFGGTMVIQGEVRGNVVVFGVSVIVDGTVNGNITAYGGSVTLQNKASVNGDIHLCRGDWTHGGEPYLHGTLYGCPASVDQLLMSDAGPSFRFWSILTWVALGVLLIVLLPEHVMLVRTTVTSKARRSLALGLLSILLALPVLAILVALIISIPLAIIVVIGIIAAWALGTVAVGSLLGEYIVRVVAPQKNTRPVQVVVGLTVLVLAGSLPYVGWFISIGAGLLGLGAVFLSRFGTRLYSQPKQPIML
ncbi:MAG: hypothetical protein NVS4B11_07290 [Ktedonobacteraceae bacterium]